MRRYFLLFILSLLGGIMWGQTHTFRHWIDNNKAIEVRGGFSGEIEFVISLAFLDNGFHAFHVQVQNNAGVWSSVHTRHFLKEAKTTCFSARYWLDNDLTTMHNDVATSGVIELDIKGLGIGLHAVHYQTMDENDIPSAVRTRYFLIGEQTTDKFTCRLWIDSDEAHAQEYELTDQPIEIDLEDLEGEHLLHVIIYDQEEHVVHEETQTFTVSEPATVKTVDVAEAGTLSNYISDSEKYMITELTVKGYLNSTDFKLLRDMAGNNYLGNRTEGQLQKLDLSGASIVTGGENYLETNIIHHLPGYGVSTLGDHLAIENDNELGKDVFKGCKLKELILPDNLTSIADDALAYCLQLTNVVMPEGLLNIGESVFMECETLQTLSIPNSVKTLGRYAFAYCYSLSSIEIPEGITLIDDNLFYDCTNLTSVIIPASVTSVNNQAFEDCNSLAEVKIYRNQPPSTGNYNVFNTQANATLYVPYGSKSLYAAADFWKEFNQIVELEPDDDIVIISSDVFSAKTVEGVRMVFKITDENKKECQVGDDSYSAAISTSTTGTVTIPSTVNGYTVKEIGYYAFDGCSHVEEFVIPEGVNQIESFAFIDCTGITGITLPNSLVYLYDSAFEGCDGLTTVTIPKNVYAEQGMIFCNSSFSKCKNMKEIKVDPQNPYVESIDNVLYLKNHQGILQYPAGKTDTSYKILDGTTGGLFGGVFSGLQHTKSIKVPEGITYINGHVFSESINLEEIELPNSIITFDGYNMIYGCTKLTKVISHIMNPWSVDSRVFQVSEGVHTSATLYVPKGTKSLYEVADGWKNFKNIIEMEPSEPEPTIIEFADANTKAICVENWDTNGDGELDTDEAAAVTDLGKKFYKNKDIESFDELKYFTGLKSIPNYAFQVCSSLLSVVIPDNVKNIGWNAFDGCYYLKKVELPEGLTTIESYAFGSCESLLSVIIPKSVTTIGATAFYSCSAMTSLTLQEGLVTIEHNAFEKCKMLLSVVIPSTVEEIGNSAFKGCSSLQSVDISNNVKTIGIYAFQSCTALRTVSLPGSIQTIGSYAFDACSELSTVKAMMEEPVEIGNYTFTNRANATLYVPIGCKALYQEAEYWKEFKNIIEMDEEETLRGDVNGDKLVNGTDLVALTCMILGQQEENAAADVYVDGLVNGTDYVALVDIILNFSVSSTRLMATRSTSNSSLMAKVGVEPFSIAAGESQTMTITLDNPNMDVTLVQLDLTLPKGLKLKIDEDGYGVEMTGRTTWKDHTVYIGSQGEESVRMMLASGKNASIDSNTGGILNLTLMADENYDGGDIILTNILCTSPNVQECRPYDYTLHLASSSTTRIDGIEDGQKSVIYSVSGQRLSAPHKGVNIINGKKVVVK